MCGPAGRSAPGGGRDSLGREEKGIADDQYWKRSGRSSGPFRKGTRRTGTVCQGSPGGSHRGVEAPRECGGEPADHPDGVASPNVFAVVDRESGHVIGLGGLVSRPQESGSSSDEIGYALDPAWWAGGSCRRWWRPWSATALRSWTWGYLVQPLRGESPLPAGDREVRLPVCVYRADQR